MTGGRRGAVMARRLAALIVASLACAACGGSGLTRPTSAGPADVVALTPENFSELVLETNRSSMVEFYSPRCPHCQAMEPVVDALATEFRGSALVGQVNTDLYGGLASAYGVGGVPTFVFFRAGREVRRRVGETTQADLAQLLRATMAGS